MPTTVAPTVIAKIRLTDTTPPSNKEYIVEMIEHPDGYAVTGWNGGIGSSLTARPQLGGKHVPLGEAEKAYAKLVNQKTAAGYKPDESSVGASGASVGTLIKERSAVDLLPQLPNEASATRARELLHDSGYCFEIKEDGNHLLTRSLGGVITAGNKKNRQISIRTELEAALLALGADFECDGEFVPSETGGTFHVFDILSLHGRSVMSCSLDERKALLASLLASNTSWLITPVRVYPCDGANAEALFNEARELGREGVVFKRRNASYVPGYNNNQLKFRFVQTLSAVVTAVHPTKDSIALSLCNTDGDLEFVGNAKAKGIAFAVGDIVEVRYGDMIRAGGALRQPDVQCKRTDVDADECKMTQIKYRGTATLSA